MFAWDPRDLNPEQAAAVIEPSSIFLIACPGSGKTRTLTYKIAYELSRRTDKRIVVAITYTHRAADEIQERIEDLGVDTSGLWIGTIHAFCLEWILKPYGIYSPALAQGYRVIDPHDREHLLERLCAPYKGVTHWDCDYYVTETGISLAVWIWEKPYHSQGFEVVLRRAGSEPTDRLRTYPLVCLQLDAGQKPNRSAALTCIFPHPCG